MSVQGDIHTIQSRLLRTMGLYIQMEDVHTLVRRRKTQVEELRGQKTTLGKGADSLEQTAEDLDRRITLLEA